jgi:hypothetical protein
MERFHVPLSNGRTMIIYMSEEQKRMLARFGCIVGMDATYSCDMWGLPLFVLVVVNAQNEGYPAAYFWISSETTEAIAEALVYIKMLVPEWKLEVMIMDHSTAEINAIEQVFPHVFILLCDFHIKQAWQRWLSCGDNQVGDKLCRMQAYTLLSRILEGSTMVEMQAALTEWEAYLMDAKNPGRSAWWKTTYADCMKMWCHAYRANVFTRGINTNNHNESLNKALKCYLILRSDLKIASMLRELQQVIQPVYDTKHAKSQSQELAVTHQTKYSSILKQQDKLFPKKVLIQMNRRVKASQQISLTSVEVVKHAELYKFKADKGGGYYSTDIKHGMCECLDFKHRRLICKHMFRALGMCDADVKWLPESFLKSPHMSFDKESLQGQSYNKKPPRTDTSPKMSDANGVDNSPTYAHFTDVDVPMEEMSPVEEAQAQGAANTEARILEGAKKSWTEYVKRGNALFFGNKELFDMNTCLAMLDDMKAIVHKGEAGHAGVICDMKPNGKTMKHRKASTTPVGASAGKKRPRENEVDSGFDATLAHRPKLKKAKSTWAKVRCSFGKCSNIPVGAAPGGYCITHGGGKRCIEKGCHSYVCGTTRQCFRHGPKFQGCQAPGCTKHVMPGSTTRCSLHGSGGERCQVVGCPKSAIGTSLRCLAHRRGNWCRHPECPKPPAGKTLHCVTHGGGQRCKEKACSKLALGKSQHCKAHGVSKCCEREGCPKTAKDARARFCTDHDEGKLKRAYSATIEDQREKAARMQINKEIARKRTRAKGGLAEQLRGQGNLDPSL